MLDAWLTLPFIWFVSYNDREIIGGHKKNEQKFLKKNQRKSFDKQDRAVQKSRDFLFDHLTNRGRQALQYKNKTKNPFSVRFEINR